MARSRSAHHTLNGYHYQFDKSILEILKAAPSDAITLEGIEDVDVGDHTIQCKYHATQKYTPSAIKKPLLAFLEHYASGSAPLNYRLYAHFNDHTSFKSIDLAELKGILGGDLETLKLKDSDLAVFLARHFVYEQAGDIDAQRKAVLKAIEASVGCTRDESKLYFYQNALHEVIRLSRQSAVDDRKTDKLTFLRAINHKRTLFSVWLCQLKGEKEYLKHVRAELSVKKAMATTKRRCIHLDKRLVQQSGTAGLTRFCIDMVDHHFKAGTALKDAVPVTVIVDSSADLLANVKRCLLESNILINDGYEHIAFQPNIFNNAPLVNLKMTSTTPPRATDIIGKTSYDLRIVSHDTYVAHRQDIVPPEKLILTSLPTYAPFDSSPLTDVFHVTEISSVDELAKALN